MVVGISTVCNGCIHCRDKISESKNVGCVSYIETYGYCDFWRKSVLGGWFCCHADDGLIHSSPKEKEK